MKNMQIFRLNWNQADFDVDVFKEAYEKEKGVMVWRHFSDKPIEKETRCILWFGTKGRRKKTKPLEGIAGIGEIIENNTLCRPPYLSELVACKKKPHFVKVHLLAVTDEALVSQNKIKSLFERKLYWISGVGKSEFVNIKYASDAKKLYDMASAEYKKRFSR